VRRFVIDPEAMEPNFRMLHGSKRWEGPPEIRPAKGDRVEHGPGLYLTASSDVARRYAKGGGKVMEFEIEDDVRWIDDVVMGLDEAIEFLRERPRLKHRDDIVADLRTAAARRGDGKVRAASLLNLMVNYKVVTGEHGPALAKFLVAHGADAEKTTFEGHDMVVLFNTDKVERWGPAASDIVDMPPVAEQLKEARLAPMKSNAALPAAKRAFDECMTVVEERFGPVGVVLRHDERGARDNGAGSERQFGFCEDGEPIVIGFAAKVERLPAEYIRGLMRHEFGHALDYKFGSGLERMLGVRLPNGAERRADAIAEAVFGEPIEYGEADIQCVGCGGKSPRPKHLAANEPSKETFITAVKKMPALARELGLDPHQDVIKSWLGAGQYARVIALPDGKRVLKLTFDVHDAVAAQRIKIETRDGAEPAVGVPRVFAVYKLDGFYRDKQTGSRHPLYAIVVERAVNFDTAFAEDAAAMAAMAIVDGLQSLFAYMTAYSEEKEREDLSEELGEEFMWLFDDIVAGHSWLEENGVFVTDIKEGNIGVVKRDGRQMAVILDFGHSSIRSGLNEMRAIPMAANAPNASGVARALDHVPELAASLGLSGFSAKGIADSQVGMGRYAYVIDVPDQGKVLKVTVDRADAVAARRVMERARGLPVRGVVQVYGVYDLGIELEDMYWQAGEEPAPAYAIVTEFVEDFDESWGLGFTRYLKVAAREVTEAVLARRGGDQWLDGLWEHHRQHIVGQRRHDWPEEFFDYLDDLIAGWNWLAKIGITVTDLHIRNLGLREGDDGRQEAVIIDFGHKSVEESADEPNIPMAKNPRRYVVGEP
jgi:hypothetical protein